MSIISAQVLTVVVMGLLLIALAVLLLFLSRRKAIEQLNRTRAELEELRLAKAANERLIARLESQVEELRRAARRSLNE